MDRDPPQFWHLPQASLLSSGPDDGPTAPLASARGHLIHQFLEPNQERNPGQDKRFFFKSHTE